MKTAFIRYLKGEVPVEKINDYLSIMSVYGNNTSINEVVAYPSYKYLAVVITDKNITREQAQQIYNTNNRDDFNQHVHVAIIDIPEP